MTAPGEFSGQVALVTGAGRGIGRAIALRLAQGGARLIINDAGCEPDGSFRVDRVAEEILAAGGVSIVDRSKIGSPDIAARLVAMSRDQFGRLDILVNNAGVSAPGAFDETSDAVVAEVMSVNLMGPYALMRACWPFMKAQRYGKIINDVENADREIRRRRWRFG